MSLPSIDSSVIKSSPTFATPNLIAYPVSAYFSSEIYSLHIFRDIFSSEAKLSKKGRKVTSDTGNGPNELQLVKAAKTGTSVLDYGETKYESPWKRLQRSESQLSHC
jgi:hypothetical protein